MDALRPEQNCSYIEKVLSMRRNRQKHVGGGTGRAGQGTWPRRRAERLREADAALEVEPAALVDGEQRGAFVHEVVAHHDAHEQSEPDLTPDEHEHVDVDDRVQLRAHTQHL